LIIDAEKEREMKAKSEREVIVINVNIDKLHSRDFGMKSVTLMAEAKL